MISLRTKRKSTLYLRAAMVIVTIVFGGIVFCGSQSNSHTSTAYKYGGLEEIEFHQALPGRLFYLHISTFYIPAELTISPIINVIGPKLFRPNTSDTLVRLSQAFGLTNRINAP